MKKRGPLKKKHLRIEMLNCFFSKKKLKHTSDYRPTRGLVSLLVVNSNVCMVGCHMIKSSKYIL